MVKIPPIFSGSRWIIRRINIVIIICERSLFEHFFYRGYENLVGKRNKKKQMSSSDGPK